MIGTLTEFSSSFSQMEPAWFPHAILTSEPWEICTGVEDQCVACLVPRIYLIRA